MKQVITAFIFLIVLQGLIAFELKVESFSYDPLDLTAISKPIKDYNGDKCSALRVETNVIPELYISGQEIFEKRKVTPSEYYFFLSFRSSMVTFSAEGYTPLYYQIPLRMEPGLVYKVVLKSIGFDPSTAVNILVVSDPSDTEKWLNGELLGTGEGYTVAPGKYKLELKKQGYSNFTREIEVSKDSFLFKDMTLKPVEEERVTIKSEPIGAEVYLNAMKRGATEAQLWLYPGTYRLRLLLSGHFELEEDIEIKPNAKNEFNYKLRRNYATVQFRVTPSDAKVFVSREEVASKRIELVNGTYSIEVKKEGYDDYRESITVVAGQDRTIDVNLTQQTGTVIIEINPANAKAVLTKEGKTVQQWTGSNRLTDLPVGEYSVTVSASGYRSTKQEFTLRKDERLTKSIYLEEGLDTPEKFVLVEGGSFQMGSKRGDSDERPIHIVTVNSFYIGKYELTQKEWVEVMGSNPSYYKGDNLPVESITWYNAIDYCNKRSVKEGLTPCYSINGNTSPSSWSSGTIVCNWNADGYRLPTEAEWEYAAHGGNKGIGYKYSGSNKLKEVGWYKNNSDEKTHPVGDKKSNELGIYDMSGNVWEWCWDWYNEDYYSSSPQNNPKGPESDFYRVRRGGSYNYSTNFCRVSDRNYYSLSYSSNYLGFRLVRSFP